MIKNKLVFISGASSGIGQQCAEAFAKLGANLILCARRIEKLEEFSNSLKEKYNIEVNSIQLDVRDREEIDKEIDSLEGKWRKIDILVNNAGLARGLDKLHEVEISGFEEMIDTNIKGVFYLTRKIVPIMLENKLAGHIINIGSIAGVHAYKGGSIYCAAKAAVKFLSDGLRMDLVDTPIRVTNIQPGIVETDFSMVRFNGDKERADNVYKGIKALTPQDIADIVVYSATVPPHVQICELIVTPTHQATGGVVHKEK